MDVWQPPEQLPCPPFPPALGPSCGSHFPTGKKHWNKHAQTHPAPPHLPQLQVCVCCFQQRLHGLDAEPAQRLGWMGYESITHGTHLNFVLLIMFTRNLQAGKNKHISLLHVVVRQKTFTIQDMSPLLVHRKFIKSFSLWLGLFHHCLLRKHFNLPLMQSVLMNFGNVLLDQRPMV